MDMGIFFFYIEFQYKRGSQNRILHFFEFVSYAVVKVIAAAKLLLESALKFQSTPSENNST